MDERDPTGTSLRGALSTNLASEPTRRRPVRISLLTLTAIAMIGLAALVLLRGEKPGAGLDAIRAGAGATVRPGAGAAARLSAGAPQR